MSRTALVVGFVIAGCQAAPEARPHRGPPVNEHALALPAGAPSTVRTGSPFDASGAVPQNREFEYSAMLSAGARDGDALPLILAIHGLGDSPAHFLHLFEGFPCPARIVAPHSNSPYASGFSWFEFRRGDLDHAGPEIARRADELFRFVTRLRAEHRTVGRPLVTGFSQGGALSFAIGAEHGTEIAEAFPIGGWLPQGVPDHILGSNAAPILAFHGADDPLIPVSRARSAAIRLKKDGIPVEVREFPGVGHEIPAAVRAALFESLAAACQRERRSGNARR